MSDPDAKIELLRHALATIAYRGGKAVRDAPPALASLRVGPGSRTPLEILAHIGDVLEWAIAIASGRETWSESAAVAWEAEVGRFFAALARLDGVLASGKVAAQPEQLLQGPIADVLTHIGQIAMLRRLADAPVRGENYFRAGIAAGRLGPVQPSPVREFD
jgi:hypothetical protein